MPCYVCKRQGHSTATCPYRIDPRIGKPSSMSKCVSMEEFLSGRETGIGRFGKGFNWQSRAEDAMTPYPPSTWRLEAALLRLHTRRITALTFFKDASSGTQRCVSGDKGGEMAVWQWRGDRGDRTVWNGHSWMVSALSTDPTMQGSVWGASCDGTIRLHHLASRSSQICQSLNVDTPPPGKDSGSSAPRKSWAMFYSVCPSFSPGCAFAGDSNGFLHHIDSRVAQSHSPSKVLAHKSSSRISSISTHPLDATLVATSGNDHTVRLWDCRKWGEGVPPLTTLTFSRSVTNVAFSPHTGKKLAVTCLDNRIYTWDGGEVWRIDGEEEDATESRDVQGPLYPPPPPPPPPNISKICEMW